MRCSAIWQAWRFSSCNSLCLIIHLTLFCSLLSRKPIRLKCQFLLTGYRGSLLLLWLVGTPLAVKEAYHLPQVLVMERRLAVAQCTWSGSLQSLYKQRQANPWWLLCMLYWELLKADGLLPSSPRLPDNSESVIRWCWGSGLGCFSSCITCCFEYILQEAPMCHTVTRWLKACQQGNTVCFH